MSLDRRVRRTPAPPPPPPPVPAPSPWPGPVAYEVGAREPFVGRERETATLISLIRSYRFVLLHAPSGAGKSSLVNAAVFPQLREDGFRMVGPARVAPALEHRPTAPDGIPPPPGAVDNPYIAGFLRSLSADADDVRLPLAVYLRRRASRLDSDGELSPTLVVLDQFEEILQTCDDYAEYQEGFMRALQFAADDRPNLRFLFVARDDQLGPILRLGQVLTDGFTAQMHLDKVLAADARPLIERPARAAGREVEPALVDEVIDQVSREHYTVEHLDAAPERRTTSSRYVGLVSLQVVMRSLWHASMGARTIGMEHLADIGSVTGAIASYYERTLAAAGRQGRTSEAQLRRLFEEQLISVADQRQMVPLAEVVRAIDGDALTVLEARAVVRRLSHGPAYVELCHDSFVGPVRESNQLWRRRHRKRNRWIAGAAVFALFSVLVGAVTYLAVAPPAAEELSFEEATVLELEDGTPQQLPFTAGADGPVTVGDVVVVDVAPLEGESHDGITLAIAGPNGQQLAFSDWPVGRDVVVTRIAEPGAHVVTVHGSDTEVALRARPLRPDDLELGAAAQRTLEEDEVAVFAVELAEGDVATVTTVVDDPAVDLATTVSTSSGDHRDSRSMGGGSATALVVPVGPGTDAEHLVAVWSFDGSPVADPFELWAARQEPRTLRVGTATSATLDTAGAVAVYAFDAEQADELVLTAVGGDAFHHVLDIRAVTASAGTVGAAEDTVAGGSSWTVQDVLAARVPTTGSYLATVWTRGEPGAPEVQVQLDRARSTPLAFGEVVTGEVTGARDVDLLTLPDTSEVDDVIVVGRFDAEMDGVLAATNAVGTRPLTADGPGGGGTEAMWLAGSGATPLVAVHGFEGSTGSYELIAAEPSDRRLALAKATSGRLTSTSPIAVHAVDVGDGRLTLRVDGDPDRLAVATLVSDTTTVADGDQDPFDADGATYGAADDGRYWVVVASLEGEGEVEYELLAERNDEEG